MCDSLNKQLKIRIEESLLKKFNEFCKENGLQKSQLLRSAIRRIIGETSEGSLYYRDLEIRRELLSKIYRNGLNISQIAGKLKAAMTSSYLSEEDKTAIREAVEEFWSIKRKQNEEIRLIVKSLK